MENIAKIQGKNLVIKIPIDNIKNGVENNPDSGFWAIKITNKRNFAQEVAEYILEFDEDETGVPAFFRLLDEISMDLIEGASENIKVKFEEGDDWE